MDRWDLSLRVPEWGSGNNDLAQAGAVFALLGTLAKVAAANMTPAADTRSLQGFPSKVFLVPGISDVPRTRDAKAKANAAGKRGQRVAMAGGNATTEGSEPVAGKVIPKLSLAVETTANGKLTATRLDTVAASSKGLCSIAWVRPSAPPLPTRYQLKRLTGGKELRFPQRIAP